MFVADVRPCGVEDKRVKHVTVRRRRVVFFGSMVDSGRLENGGYGRMEGGSVSDILYIFVCTRRGLAIGSVSVIAGVVCPISLLGLSFFSRMAE